MCNINKWLNDQQGQEAVMKFLMGVNESFSQVRSQVLLMDPIPSLRKVYSLMIQEETQRSISNACVVKVDSTVLAAKVSTDQVNHVTNLVNFGGKGKDIPICTHCGKTGHTVDKCYKLHGFPLGFKFKNRPSRVHQVSSGSVSKFASPMHQFSAFTPEQCQQLLALFGASNPSLATPSQALDSPMANGRYGFFS